MRETYLTITLPSEEEVELVAEYTEHDDPAHGYYEIEIDRCYYRTTTRRRDGKYETRKVDVDVCEFLADLIRRSVVERRNAA